MSIYGRFLLGYFEKDACRREKHVEDIFLAKHKDDIAYYICEKASPNSFLFHLQKVVGILKISNSFSARDWIICEVYLLIADSLFFSKKQNLFRDLESTNHFNDAVPHLIMCSVARTQELRLRGWFYRQGWQERNFSHVKEHVYNCLVARVNAYLALYSYSQKEYDEAALFLEKCTSLHATFIFPLIILAELQLSAQSKIRNLSGALKNFYVCAKQEIIPTLRLHSLIRLAQCHAMGIGVPKDLKSAHVFYLEAMFVAKKMCSLEDG